MQKVGQQTTLDKQFWIGLSSETKPVLTVNNADSRFYCTDTRQEFIWNGTSWIEGINSDYWTNLINKGKAEKIPKNFVITGNVDQTLLTPPVGKRLRLQVLLLVGEGSGGDIYLYRTNDTVTILPLWMSSSTRSNTSSELNMLLDVDESLKIVTTGRNANRTFIGLGYTLE